MLGNGNELEPSPSEERHVYKLLRLPSAKAAQRPDWTAETASSDYIWVQLENPDP